MKWRKRAGWLRETAILVPSALALVALLCVFTLSSYRSAIEALRDERGLASGEAATGELARQELVARRLTWVVLPGLGAVTVLLLFYLRRVLAPWERLAVRAREVDPRASGDIADLVAAFEDALTRLSDERREAGLGDLLEALGRGLDTGVLVADRELATLEVNEAGRRLLGLTEGERGRLLEHRPELAAVLEAAREGERTTQRTLQGGTYEERTLGVSAFPLRRDDGSVRGVLALVVDLTAATRRERRDRLAASLTELGELSAGLAHELRNGLATVRGYLTLIERRPDSESVAEYVEPMQAEADHLQHVLDDFLAFARPEPPRETDLDLDGLLRDAAADPALAPQRAVVAGPPAESASVSADGRLLRRALRNLLLNAARAQDEAGVESPIEVSLEWDARHLLIRVRDRGGGPPENPERLFHPFVSGRADGVGLGLPLAQRIAALHGGHLELAPRDPGPGAVATLALPLSQVLRNETSGAPDGHPDDSRDLD